MIHDTSFINIISVPDFLLFSFLVAIEKIHSSTL